MLLILLGTCALIVITVGMHAVGFSVLLRTMLKSDKTLQKDFLLSTLLLIGMVFWLLLIHMAEITVWGLFYFWQGFLPDAESAFYFSGVTYATVGYGDLLLPQPWRMLGPVEGLTGILMCGLSTGFFFAFFSRILGPRFRAESTLKDV